MQIVRKRDTTCNLPEITASFLFSPPLSGSCQGMMRTKFLRDVWIQPQSVTARGAYPNPDSYLFIYLFIHLPLFIYIFIWNGLSLTAKRTSTMRGNSTPVVCGGWKALGTLGRKPLDLMFWSDKTPNLFQHLCRLIWMHKIKLEFEFMNICEIRLNVSVE